MKQIKTIIPLFIALFTLVSYQFIGAAWTNAPANPPAANAETPLHTGAAQSKSGALTTGNQGIISTSPTEGFLDTNNRSWWIHVNNDNMYFVSDNDNNNVLQYPNDWPAAITISADNAIRFTDKYVFYNNGHFAGNWIQANNQMRSNSYCDINGANCFSPSSSVGGGPECVAVTKNQVKNNSTVTSSNGTNYSASSLINYTWHNEMGGGEDGHELDIKNTGAWFFTSCSGSDTGDGDDNDVLASNLYKCFVRLSNDSAGDDPRVNTILCRK